MKLVRDMAVQPDRVAIVVTHDPRVLEFGDRIITMEDGRIQDNRHRVPPGASLRDPDRFAPEMLGSRPLNGQTKGTKP